MTWKGKAMSASDCLQAFTDEVLQAASANTDEVVPVVLAVVGGILCAAEPRSVALQRMPEGEGSVLWASFGGPRMAFRFNAMTAMIEARVDTLDGHPDRRFGRRSLPMDILNFFGPDRAAVAARTRG
jgi:hypothetical protein